MPTRYAALSLPLLACLASAGGAADPDKPKTAPGLPPVTAVLTASRSYSVSSLALTRHAGWTESLARVNVPQEVRLEWKVDRGGEAVIEGRPAWDALAPWTEHGRWKNGKGERTLRVAEPVLLRLRVRAARFPRSGIARIRAAYQRRTIAALRGLTGPVRHPVIVADGYDPFNTSDLNDPTWPEFVRLVNEGRSQHAMDPWILDWGDGGAPLEQQAEDFVEIARQVREWNGGRNGTVAVGISMGAISLRYALAGSADTLGVTRYVSVNGPHRGAWINPDLLKFLRKRAAGERSKDPGEDSEAFLIRRGLENPAAQELLMGGERHAGFYAALRSRGADGYHPGIPRVAFSNGSLVKEGNDLEELVEGESGVIHRVSVKPLGLPVWITVHKTRQSFRYGGFPGELLPESLRGGFREHVRFLSIFRFDFRARWETIPTFVPTHSALDFPEEITGETQRYRYAQWRQSAFPTIYVSPYRNMAHDDRNVVWTNPRSGMGAPEGWNAILYEISEGFKG